MKIKLVKVERRRLMWESKMCMDKATLVELELLHAKLEPVHARDRSPSPIPGIQRALFQVLA